MRGQVGSCNRTRLRTVLGAVVVLGAYVALLPAELHRPEVVFGFAENVQIAEAQAWWNGRLDLPERRWDTAWRDGKAYSYFPPMFSIVSAAVVPWFDGVPRSFIVGLTLLVPLSAYGLMVRVVGSIRWAVVLAVGLVCGTSYLPVATGAIIGAKPYSVNHTLAVIGLLVLLLDLCGPRRIWPACLGLMVAPLSRQLTIVFALPILIAAWLTPHAGQRVRRLSMVGVACLAIALLYGGLNIAKFGHPLRTGYMLNHEGRDDVFAREARAHGLLSLHWVPRNVYHMNVGLPEVHRIEMGGHAEWYLRPNSMGTGIWWTSPILLWVFVSWRSVRSDPVRAGLLISSVLLFACLMLWHATGAMQRGFNRYSLDFLPVLFVLLAPESVAGRRRWVTLALVVWGVVYFRWIPFAPPVRIW